MAALFSATSHQPAAQVVMQLVDEGRLHLDEVWRSVAGGKLEAQLGGARSLVESPINGGFNGKIIYKWAIFHGYE